MDVTFSGEAFISFVKSHVFDNLYVELRLLDGRKLTGHLAGPDDEADGVRFATVDRGHDPAAIEVVLYEDMDWMEIP